MSAGVQHEGSQHAYSKDFWDDVFEHVAKTRLVKWALVVLLGLYATAIYAPWIANDRPYVIESIDYGEYARAQRTLTAVAASIERLTLQTREEYEGEGGSSGVAQSFDVALRAELQAMEQRLATMRMALADDVEGPLDELEGRLVAAVEAAVVGKSAEAALRAQEGRELAKAMRSDFVAADPEDPAAGGMQLRTSRRYPILAATTWSEAFFMWLWALLLTWPLWNGLVNRNLLGSARERIRRARRIKVSCVLGSSALVALLWALFVGGEMTFESSTIKADLSAGRTVATRVLFPPLAMGYAENRLSEAIRPPTWRRDAELFEAGGYVRGPRVVEPDAETGQQPPANPVAVLSAEPGLNSPWRHVLGTDFLGRDLLSRILHGGRISLLVGVVSTVLLVLIGVVMGALAGYFGGWVDIAISRTIEMFQAVPAFFLILVAVAMLPEDRMHPMFAIVFFIAAVRWTGVARLVRAEFLRLKEQEFVIAAEALGFSHLRVIFRHVLPNAMGPVFVAAAFSVAAGILTESSISFLGLGVQHPTPSWGSLLNEAKGAVDFWWLQLFPGLLIFVTVFCYNVVGEGLRDALDPRRRA